MKLQKLPNDLSVEELLKALEQTSKEENQKAFSQSLPDVDENEFNDAYPVASFLNAFDIKDGKNLVSDAVLYSLFKIWNKETKLDKNWFNKQLLKFLNFKKITRGQTNKKFYYVNDSATKLVKYIDHYRKEKKRNTRTNKNYKKYYEKFFKDIGIERGPLFVEADVLYHVYDTYMYKRNRRSYPYHNFELVCTLLFEVKYFTDYSSPWFGVSENIKQHISKEAVSNWRKGRKLRGIKERKVKEEHKDKIIYPEVEEN